MVSANHDIANASQTVQSTTSAAVSEITQSRSAVETAVKHIAELVEAVGRIEARLATSARPWRKLRKYPARSRQSRKQTNLLALNATIEAARAGDRRPRLCGRRQRSEEPRGINSPGHATDRRHRARLDGQVGSLIGESGEASIRAKSAGEGAQQIRGIIVRVQEGFASVGREIDGVARAATSNLEHCDTGDQ